jgi:hypothetical protein
VLIERKGEKGNIKTEIAGAHDKQTKRKDKEFCYFPQPLVSVDSS